MLILLMACTTIAPPTPARAPGWLVLRPDPAGSETRPHDAPLLVPMVEGLEDAQPGHRYTLWSELGQLPATVMGPAKWPCGEGTEAVAIMARGKIPDAGALWLTPGPPEPGVFPLRPFEGHLGNLVVRADDRFVVSMGDDVFHDGPLDRPHEPHIGWLRADQTALLLLRRETRDAVVYRPVDVSRTGATVWRDIVVPRCR